MLKGISSCINSYLTLHYAEHFIKNIHIQGISCLVSFKIAKNVTLQDSPSVFFLFDMYLSKLPISPQKIKGHQKNRLKVCGCVF